MNLSELIYLITPFGYTEEEIRERLSYGDSAFNAYQGLKVELEIRWDEIRNRTSEPLLLEELEELYSRIMNTHLKSVIRVSDVRKEKDDKRRKMIVKLQQQMVSAGQEEMNKYLDKLEGQRGTDQYVDKYLKDLEQ